LAQCAAEYNLRGRAQNLVATNDLIRRGLDVTLASLGLLAVGPVLLLAIAGVRLEDGGPVFYRARRVGKDGRGFTMWKLRTMVRDADRVGPSITSGHDPRITRVGRFLRKSKIDELPQLYNVIVGDMTIVGPRPEAPDLADRYTPSQRRILAFTPGVTSPGSLHYARQQEGTFPTDGSPELYYLDALLDRKIEEDIAYLQRRTVRSDLAVMARTAVHVAREALSSLRGTAGARD
jgi:lipopolysaccharide/colanic/teichoic acid biosynthesis glycosyltransferase